MLGVMIAETMRLADEEFEVLLKYIGGQITSIQALKMTYEAKLPIKLPMS